MKGDQGGAIKVVDSQLEIRDSKFEKNEANNGAALYLDSSPANISKCLFQHNSAHFAGGAIMYYKDRPRLEDNEFQSNVALYGMNIGSYGVDLREIVFTEIKAGTGIMWEGQVRIQLVDGEN